jgi:GT2 family glycosyltransferase
MDLETVFSAQHARWVKSVKVTGRYVRELSMPGDIEVSVIVPTYQRNDLLSRCLESLAPGTQTISPDLYEVIVTDDGRRITGQDLVKEQFPWAKWTQGPGDGPAANRNHGAKLAQGKLLAFIDDDCLADPEWLTTVTSAAEDADIIEGRTIIPDHVDNPFKQGVENLTGGAYWSCNLAIKRDLFRQLNGFDEEFKQACAEDMEFAYRATKLGKAKYVPEALVYHPVRTLTWKTIYQRSFLTRWHLLYRHKTGKAIPPTESFHKALYDLVVGGFVHRIRCTWHLVSRHNPRYWRTNLFFQIWNWLMFPITVAYLIRWELDYRKQVRDR